ncbi:hypothetical protein EDF60_2946 [Leucobacter luti]|nr:hypothetical protein [Leucobacter luti]TCK34270.1 hypothetical protein EDF60_2946 [Leucobacter luti]
MVSAWPGELSRPAHHRPCFPRCWRSTAPRKSSARRDPPAPPDLRDSEEPRELRSPREPLIPPGPTGERTTGFCWARAVCLRSEGIMRIFHPMPQLCTAKYCPMWIVRGFSPPVSYCERRSPHGIPWWCNRRFRHPRFRSAPLARTDKGVHD